MTAAAAPQEARAALCETMFAMANKPRTTNSVDRALAILELVAQVERGQTHSEVCRRLGIPKSTATYLLRTLEHRGYLRRDADSGRFRIGLKVLGLGQHVLAGLDLPRIARPHLERVVEETHFTVHLAILDHGRPVYIDRAEQPGFIKINTWVGRELSVHSTAVGKVLTSELEREEVEEILARDGLQAKTPKTITEASAFFRELQRVREQGYALDDEENNLGVRCLSVPIRDATGSVRAALGASSTTSLFREEAVPAVRQKLESAAARISRELGYEGGG